MADFSFDDENVVSLGARRNKVKLVDGKRYRMSIAWWGNGFDKSPTVRRLARAFVTGVGPVAIPSPDFAAELGVEAQERWFTVVLNMPLLADGKIDSVSFKAEPAKYISYWDFPKSIMTQLKEMHINTPLNKWDVGMSVKGEKLARKITYTPAAENLYLTLKDQYGLEAVVADYVRNLNDENAKEMTIEEVRSKIAQAASNAAAGGRTFGAGTSRQASSVQDVDMDDLLG